jgi:hypothetical protein
MTSSRTPLKEDCVRNQNEGKIIFEYFVVSGVLIGKPINLSSMQGFYFYWKNFVSRF